MAFSWNIAQDIICQEIPTLTPMEDICFPGGACLSHLLTTIQSVPSPSEIPLEFLAQLGPATSFLQPFMNVLDTVLALFKCFEGIVDFATSLNPSGILECIPNLLEKVNAMIQMIPQLSIPRMVIAIIKALIALLRGMAYDLQYITERAAVIAQQIDRAADLNDIAKSGYLACAQTTMDDSLAATALALKSVGRIILLVNIFMGLFGGPEIPCFGQLLEDADTDALQPIIDVMNAIADLLQQILDLIPDPIAALTKALGAAKC